jgi:PAS domain S-box-containing protein
MLHPKPGPAVADLSPLEQNAIVYAAVVDSALDAVIVVDEDGAVVTLNPAAEATFGYSRQEAIGRKIGALIVPEHHRQAHEQGMARYRATREPHVLGRRVEMEAVRKDGTLIPVELAITEVNLPGGRLFTANLRDLSAAKAALAEIERQRDALTQNEKLAAIGSLLAGVAHELNNPLSVVLGQATMLREEVMAGGEMGSISSRAAQIQAAAERCARVVRSFVAIARQHKPEKRMVALAPLLDGSIDLLLYGLRSNGVAITRDYDGSIPEVLADPDQIQQIIVNLLVNANQALQEVEGPRAVRVSAVAGDDGHLRIVVADNGPGIAPEIIRRIFDPFFTTKPQGVGTGIGLSISRGLAEAQGGQLELVPTPLGAAFELRLPLPPDGQVKSNRDAVEAVAASAQADGRRAIVIDDEAEIARLIAEALERAGYRCDLASSGREAQGLIASCAGAYDAVVCDLRMPDIDGPALFRWIVVNHPALAERILFVTGDALGAAAGRFLAETRRPFLEKPFTPADVAQLVVGLPRRGA